MNTHTNRVTDIITTAMVVAGGLIAAFAPQSEATQAQITHQGSLNTSALHSASNPPFEQSIVEREDVGPQLALGMLLVLLGFVLHALFVLRHEKPVTNTKLPPRTIDGKDLTVHQKYFESFWIERK